MYDLIVIGDDLSSHIAAAYASHNRIKTLLIAPKGLGGLQLLGDCVFHLDPTPLTGLAENLCSRTILDEIGIALPEASTLQANPAYQIILPQHRIDFFNTPESLRAELARAFPQYDEEFENFYTAAGATAAALEKWMIAHPHLQPHSLKQYFAYLKIYPQMLSYKFAAVKLDKILSQDTALEKIWEAQHALLACNHFDLFSLGSALQYSAPFRGVAHLPQGKQYLFNETIKKVEMHSGLYLENYEVLSIDRGKILQLKIRAKNGQTSDISARHLIISTKSDFLDLFADPPKALNFSERFRPSNIVYYPFTLYLGVLQTCLPEHLARHVAVVPEVSKNLFDDNLLILETDLAANPPSASHTPCALTVTSFLPPDAQAWTTDALKHSANKMMKRLEFFLPFLKDHIELFDLNQSIDLSIAARHVVTPKIRVRNALTTSFAAKSHKTRHDNVFLTGAPLLSDAGFDGEILSGKNAVLHVLKKRNEIHDQ